MVKKFTQKEVEYITKNYKIMSNREMARTLIDRSPDTIGEKIKHLGLKKTNEEIYNNYNRNRLTKKYTSDELNFITNNYKTMSNDEIGAELGLTRDAIRKKLKRLGLKKTSEEIKINFQNNKHKNGSPGIFHPLYGTHRPQDVKNKIIKKLKYRTTPYIKKTIRVNGKNMPMSHFVWCSQPENLSHVPEGFVIHHYDGNPENNSPNNLVLLPSKYHSRIHCQLSQIIRSKQPQWDS